MKRTIISINSGLIFLLTLFAFTNVNSQVEFKTWADKPSNEIVDFSKRINVPVNYRTFTIDLNKLRSQLNQAPLEGADQLKGKSSNCVISLPTADGKEKLFNIIESPVMEKELAATYPFIKTYIAQQIDNPEITARLDITQLGFHAMIMDRDGFSFIEPIHIGNTIHYLSYFKKDSRNKQDFICETFSEGDDNISHRLAGLQNAAKSNGTQLRTYRLALACTGEYAAVFGGTASAALSAMVTSVNRVNGVYEKEVSVRLILIGNDSLLVYTNAATDPYTNNSGSTMLGENITNINNVIGLANYDIGHVFSTGGGGVAGLGVVCTSSKARGVTGSGTPFGDAFDIDYVAHEIGHQFSGNHTFNSVTNSCGGGNRNASTAYEIGSGVTIMAYAGICGADNLAPNSIAYFHTKSFEEIVNFTNTGSGNTCPVTTNTGNSAPVVTVGIDYSIPISTPFILTGSATDANGDPLTYSWEELDQTATGGAWNQTQVANTDFPLFRPFVPVNDGIRIFPKISDIVNNTTTIGERLPSVARVLDFRLTARDNKNGGGGVTYNDVTQKITVDAASGPFLVTYPNISGILWNSFGTEIITWNVANSNLTPINCAIVKISLSNDGGYTYPTVILASTPNDGSEAITVPNVITSQARIKVEAVGNIFFDISNVNFTIQVGSPVLTSISTTALASSNLCIGTSFPVTYFTDGPANAGNIFTAELSNSSGSFSSGVTNIGSIASTGNGVITAIVLPGTTRGLYRIRVVSSNPVVNGSDNGSNISVFDIPAAAGSITGSSVVCQGQNGVSYSIPVIANATNYNWNIPAGATIASGANTNSINVNFSPSAAANLVFTVTGSNAGCGSGIISPGYNITVNSLPGAAGSITGTNVVCQGTSGITYTVPAISGASSYNWSLPAGVTITSPVSNSIVVSFSASAVSGNITVAGVNSCGTGTASVLPVIVNPTPSATVLISSDSTSVCAPATVTLSFVPAANTSYQWRLNGTDIAGVTGSTYVATQSGNYDVMATGLAQSIYTNSTPASIPDALCTGATSPIIIGGYGGTVNPSGISVKINVTHTWVGDLSIFLVAPNGDILGLSNRVGSSGDNFVNTVFADSGSAILPSTGAPYTNLYKPWSPVFTSCITSTKTTFGSINSGSINPNGTWNLRAFDLVATDIGTINNWTLTLPKRNSICTSASNTITVTISSVLTSGITIQASPSTTVCPGTTITYAATPTNPGSTPVYQWKKNGINVGTNNNIYIDPSPIGSDSVTCLLTSSLTCVTVNPDTSNSIIISVTPPASISGFSPASGIPGDQVIISGNGLNAVSVLRFNGINATYTTVNNNQINATVPFGATSGLISIIDTCGAIVNSASGFIILTHSTLNTGLFIEGYYIGGGVMRNPAGVNTDTLLVQLYDSTNLIVPAFSRLAILNNAGVALVAFPGALSGQYFYIVVRHRNSVETWSKLPVLFSPNTFFSFKN